MSELSLFPFLIAIAALQPTFVSEGVFSGGADDVRSTANQVHDSEIFLPALLVADEIKDESLSGICKASGRAQVAGRPVSYFFEILYDRDGNPIQKVTNSDGSLQWILRRTWRYRDGVLHEMVIDRPGVDEADSMNRFEFDNLGRIVSWSSLVNDFELGFIEEGRADIFYRDGLPIGYSNTIDDIGAQFSYADGRVSTLRYDLFMDGEDDWVDEFTWDEQRIQSRKDFYLGELRGTHEYSYNDKGELIRIEEVFDGAVSKVLNYRYSASGNMLSEELILSGQREYELVYRYDSENRITSWTEFGHVFEKTTSIEYDCEAMPKRVISCLLPYSCFGSAPIPSLRYLIK